MRKPRTWYPGAAYHIVNRGNRKSDIFWEAKDYLFYLELLRMAVRRYPCNLLGYCLMTNHVHLLLETIDTPPGPIIQYIHGNYTVYFNRKYDLEGHLFKGRYRDTLIECEAHELATSRYIHLNPVKAGLVEKPEAYPWSSYRAYLGGEGMFRVPLAVGQMLDFFEGDPREQYRAYVEAGIDRVREER